MLFDSEMIPGVTRIEAGKGVKINYVVNSDFEGVWYASLDSEYLTYMIAKNVSNDSEWILNQIQSTVSDLDSVVASIDSDAIASTLEKKIPAGLIQDIIKDIDQLQEILGIVDEPYSPSPALGTSDPIYSSGIGGYIQYFQTGEDLDARLKVSFSIKNVNADTTYSTDLLFGAETHKNSILKAFLYQVKNSSTASEFLEIANYNAVSDILEYKFRDLFQDFYIELKVLEPTNDARFVVTKV